jgi:hypothetical protein
MARVWRGLDGFHSGDLQEAVHHRSGFALLTSPEPVTTPETAVDPSPQIAAYAVWTCATLLLAGVVAGRWKSSKAGASSRLLNAFLFRKE